jgi:hypothetical protein
MEELTRYQKYYRENRDRVLQRKHAYDKAHREELSVKQRMRNASNPNFKMKDAKRAVAYRSCLKKEVFAHYGNICACCGESIFELLCLDHINGGGTRQRRETGKHGSTFYAQLRRDGYPSGFRILCYSCNHSFGAYGYCPHQAQDIVDKHKNKQKLRTKQAECVAKYLIRLRYEVIGHYGAFCACCKETKFEFLCIDHIDGGGTRHRKEIGGNSARLYAWLRKNNYPLGFRVLCHNCNQSFGIYGNCPHQNPENHLSFPSLFPAADNGQDPSPSTA